MSPRTHPAKASPTRKRSGRTRPRVGHGRLLQQPLDKVRPSPENDNLYRPVRDDDPEIVALADSIRRWGVREPIVITADGWILSGHRRHAAARLAGLETVPCRVESIRRVDDPDAFVVLLREYNRQRDKSLDEKLREELVTTDPEEAYTSLLEHRQERARVDTAPLELTSWKMRKQISAAKKKDTHSVEGKEEPRRDGLWLIAETASPRRRPSVPRARSKCMSLGAIGAIETKCLSLSAPPSSRRSSATACERALTGDHAHLDWSVTG